ncbi:glycoprotein-N-acetylgalactosamine 3-beta-galactosyltransferase 1-like [Contarinia nasturtii]|uniref:glycoprotein-N-acetylgalactosamine 3-beta-galactosyltransferase 1-like n=1 Tax=Contarinia nasturtii TaxID=265458 RepID=UPI0012D44C3F|nr:glycoprotein-N-acetylgalactosamine 3-beta-galactosyltransferase 1-like [Contarinia nasturtii]
MFLMPENLRFMLSAYSTDDPIYFGHKFNTTDHKWGYFSGGSGYAMSRKTLRIFVEKVLTNKNFYNNPKSVCNIKTDDRIEDYDISRCLDYYNVYPGDARDLLKRDRFLPFWPEEHFFIRYNPTYWYWQRKYYWNDDGLDCCSNYTIAFHYISASYQYTMYYLIYKLQPYGINPRYPKPPMQKDFKQVANLLDRERYDPTFRGY